MLKKILNSVFTKSKKLSDIEYVSRVYLLRNLISKVYKNRLRSNNIIISAIEIDRDILFVKGLGLVTKRKGFTKFEKLKIDTLYEKYSELEKTISNN